MYYSHKTNTSISKGPDEKWMMRAYLSIYLVVVLLLLFLCFCVIFV